jgi:hypothetical protein
LTATIEYVYCVVPAALVVNDAPNDALRDAPRGLDRAPVRSIARGDVAALVSAVEAEQYSGDAPSERMGDPEWLTPRAVAHDAIITWAADRDAVVPFPMWVMFGDERAVSAMLDARRDEFREILDRVSGARELCVRISADQIALANAAERMDDRLGELERQADVATPGQAYLMRRKLAELRKSGTRDAASRIADHAHSALSDRSRDSVARVSSVSNEPGLLLDAAYLVDNDRYDSFRSALTALMATYTPAGLRFDFTGPWPPYHFVRDR